MDENNLVVLKQTQMPFKNGHTAYNSNLFYRACILGDNIIVNGEPFTEQLFNEKFETAQSRILRDWTGMNMFKPNGLPLSKTAFGKLANIHTYGNGRDNLKVLYFHTTRECIYGFYPMFRGETKAMSIKLAYGHYLDVINGNMDCVDSKLIQFGNCGIPIGYGNLRLQKTEFFIE